MGRIGRGSSGRIRAKNRRLSWAVHPCEWSQAPNITHEGNSRSAPYLTDLRPHLQNRTHRYASDHRGLLYVCHLGIAGGSIRAREVKVKDNVHPRTGYEDSEGEQIYSSALPLTSALGGGGSTPRPGCFTPGKDPVPTVKEAGWTPRPVWTGAENFAPTGIRSRDRPTSSESIYRLNYPGPYGQEGANEFVEVGHEL
jgi:hypothetical protein